MFFQTSANLNDNEKARIEFLAQRISRHIDSGLMEHPVRGLSEFIAACGTPYSAESLLDFIAEHLRTGIGGLTVRNDLKVLPKTGGGG